MRKLVLTALAGIACMLAAVLQPTSTRATANATVTFVSANGVDGNTVNLCSQGSPCGSIAAAISVTTPGGTVVCLSPALTTGPVTITQDVTIDCNQGSLPLAAAAVGGTGITINTPGINVTLRGLAIYGLDGASNPNGVQINAAASVRIEDCKIYNFGSGNGVLIAPSTGSVSVKIQDSTISKNSTGIKIAPSGGATVAFSMERSRSENNAGGGVRVDASGSGAITATITDSNVSFNGGNAVNAISGSSGNVLVNLTHDTIASNAGAAVQANQSAGGGATVTVTKSTLSNNGSAWSIVGGATLLSFKDNAVTGPTGSTPAMANFQ
jgi:hypothetical protein